MKESKNFLQVFLTNQDVAQEILKNSEKFSKSRMISEELVYYDEFVIQDFVHTMLLNFEYTKNVTDSPASHTKTAHFCRQILKTINFENRTLTDTFLKQHRVKTPK